MKLFELANVLTGILKTRLNLAKVDYKGTSEESYYLLNYACFGVNNYFIKKDFDKINIKEKFNKNVLVQKGDIVVKLFPPITFNLVDQTYPNLLVPSNIAIIRAKAIDPILLIFLLETIKAKLEHSRQGIALPLLNLKELKEIEIGNEKMNDAIILKKAKIAYLLNTQIKLIEKKKYYLDLRKKYFIKK